ncbi:MAG: hypothetical protein ACRD1V_14665 [Vicinamibacterales bacterium]
MAPTDGAPAAAANPQGPSRGLLMLLVVVVVGALALWLWPAAAPTAEPSNQTRTARGPQGSRAAAPLTVRLDALKQPEPQPAATERNPFRFQPKPPPPAPDQFGARGAHGAPGAPGSMAPERSGPPPLPPVPPIPLKFIGIENPTPVAGRPEGQDTGKVAIFVNADGRGQPMYGREGQMILGQYRIVKIGIESVVMEYADGRGRQTIPLRGQ